MKRSMLLVLVATILLLVWFNDVFVGYYVFVKECERSGGVKFNDVIDDNGGWLVSDEASAQSVVSSFSSIPFARFKSADGQWMDVEYTGGNPWWEQSYNKKKADDRKVLYRWLSDSSLVPNKIRLMSFKTRLINEKNGQTVMEWLTYRFTWFDSENTLLGSSTSVYCPPFNNGLQKIANYIAMRDEG